MTSYNKVKRRLHSQPKVWLITGVAGFIGSNLLEALLKLDQIVVGLDNFCTGHRRNLDDVQRSVSSQQWKNFHLFVGDIREYAACEEAVSGVDYVLHQAGLSSITRSVSDPLTSNSVNVTGFLNVLHAAKEERVSSFTYASSSSVYGDHVVLPKVENNIGNPLSPYAVTKRVNELYAEVYAGTYGFDTIGLRYFNVFGPRQDPESVYAAVIPKWIVAMIENREIRIYGDGQSSRDFCFVDNCVQMNILAAVAAERSKNQVYNVSFGDRNSLQDIFIVLKENLAQYGVGYTKQPIYCESRTGDVRHSQANISKAQSELGYLPIYRFEDGLKTSILWYKEMLKKKENNLSYK